MARSSVGRSRSSSKINNKLNHTLKQNANSAPSLTLLAILSDLKLSYNAKDGVLGGEGIISGPNLDNLSLLRKSLNNLKLQLEKVISDDTLLLNKIESKLQLDGNDESKKRSLDIKDELDEKDKVDEVEDEEDEMLRPKKKKVKIELNNLEPTDEGKDDDDIPLLSVRAPENRATVNAVASHKDFEIKSEDKADEQDEEDEDVNEADYHTPEDDTRIKNPKSEFVTAQTLPLALALLGLYSEETGGLDQTGEEYLKRKYAVASYPTRDLQDMLPGPIPDIDFSKNKPSNQVQFTTFQSYTDIYFRPYTEDDIKFLKEKYTVIPQLGKNYDPLLHLFLIPKLGPLYADVWSQEEPLNGVKLSTPSSVNTSNSVMPHGSLDQLTDELLETDLVSCGPLVTRLLSALMPDQMGENNVGVKNEDDENNDIINDKGSNSSSSLLEDQQGWNANISQADYSQLEQRLRRELKYIGVYMNVNQSLKEKQATLMGQIGSTTAETKIKDEFQEDWINGREDDEICTEMRSLQRELSQLVRKNNKRKQILIPIVEEQIAWQEYMSILDDLDKQIDQLYTKRMRVPKKLKKRGHASLLQQQQQISPSVMAAQQLQQLQQAAANSGLKSLLDKRLRWINKIGPLFKSNELMRRIPNESVFKDVDLNKDDEENEEVDDGSSGINNTNGGNIDENGD